jgi:hypothetical protein
MPDWGRNLALCSRSSPSISIVNPDRELAHQFAKGSKSVFRTISLPVTFLQELT